MTVFLVSTCLDAGFLEDNLMCILHTLTCSSTSTLPHPSGLNRTAMSQQGQLRGKHCEEVVRPYSLSATSGYKRLCSINQDIYVYMDTTKVINRWTEINRILTIDLSFK
jgi:hypothetical protein